TVHSEKVSELISHLLDPDASLHKHGIDLHSWHVAYHAVRQDLHVRQCKLKSPRLESAFRGQFEGLITVLTADLHVHSPPNGRFSNQARALLNADYCFLVEFDDHVALSQSRLIRRTVGFDPADNRAAVFLIFDRYSDPTGILGHRRNGRPKQ